MLSSSKAQQLPSPEIQLEKIKEKPLHSPQREFRVAMHYRLLQHHVQDVGEKKGLREVTPKLEKGYVPIPCTRKGK
jgi:hypothetical protein